MQLNAIEFLCLVFGSYQCAYLYVGAVWLLSKCRKVEDVQILAQVLIVLNLCKIELLLPQYFSYFQLKPKQGVFIF